MRINLLSRTVAAALFVVLSTVAVTAQVTRGEGKVTLKQADGKEAPVADAVVEFFRTDISGKFQTKSDKSGNYVHAGLPFGGTFIIAASAPGARPEFITGVRVNQQPANNFALSPGDGTRLTLEQIKASMAAPGAGQPAAAGGGGRESKEAKAQREEAERKNAEILESNKKVEEANVVINRVFKAGNEAFAAKRYDEALTNYDEGLRADPEQAVLYLNKSIVLKSRAVENFNAALKAKDTAAKDAAKADFSASADNAEKAVKYYREVVSKRSAGQPAAAGGAAAGGAASPNRDESLNYLAARSEAYRLALLTSTPVTSDLAVTAIQEYVTAETDPAKKAKAEASLGDALFQGGKIDEAVAAYQKVLASNPNNLEAMFGLGIALAADPSGAKNTEARDLLQKFADKTDAANPRKQEAMDMAKYLDDTIKNPAKALEVPKGTVRQGAGRKKN
ncbi:MAG: tetratricopeptide repeat protein [Acidobacteriota bacterium]|nr:tetratricopeptide repeat protein [Acidobacteriota bacterium]